MVNTNTDEPSATQSSRMARFLRVVEALGNALPHPVTLFALFSIGIVLLSGVLGWLDVAVTDPRPEGSSGRAPNGLIEVVSLMNADGFHGPQRIQRLKEVLEVNSRQEKSTQRNKK